MGTRELAKWLGVVLIAVAVGIGALNGRHLADWGKGLFVQQPNAVGATIHVAASTYHPALDVSVDRVDDIRATGLAPGQHAVAVRVRIANVSGSAWRLGPDTSMRLYDSLGLAYAPTGRARTDLNRLPTRLMVPAHGATEGYVVFTLPQGRSAWKVSVRLAPTGEGALVWELPR